MRKKINVLLVDDHPIVVFGLDNLIKLVNNMEVVGKALNGSDALRIMESKNVDIIIMDISMPGLNGLDFAKIIKEVHPEVKIIFVTVYDNEDYVLRAEKMGVEGYILKEEAPDVIVEVIRNVKNGFVDYRVGRNLPATNYPVQMLNLSKRETEVFKMIIRGKTSNEIAENLDISVRTVERHRLKIRKKLNLKSSLDIFKIGVQYKLIDTNFPIFGPRPSS